MNLPRGLVAIATILILITAGCVSKKLYRSEIDEADAQLQEARMEAETLERDLQETSAQLEESSGRIDDLKRKVADLERASEVAAAEGLEITEYTFDTAGRTKTEVIKDGSGKVQSTTSFTYTTGNRSCKWPALWEMKNPVPSRRLVFVQ